MIALKHCRNLALLGWLASLEALAAIPQPAVDLASVRERMATLTAPFVPNAGQWDHQAAFATRTLAATLFVTTEGQLVYSLPGKAVAAEDDAAAGPPSGPRSTSRAAREPAAQRTPGWVLTETFVDADLQAIRVTPSAGQLAATQVSYFHGNAPGQQQRGLPSYERIELGEVFPGVTVQLRATGANVEKLFTVAPHTDLGRIRIALGGATGVELGSEGELIAHTGNGPVVYTAPQAFQTSRAGHLEAVAARYVLDTRTLTYGFALAAYDPARPLLIDPLLRSTYLGANGYDQADALAIHPATGAVYVAGQTTSATNTFPGVSGGVQGSYGGGGVATPLSAASAPI